jgi:hypothetical protein
MKTPFGPSSKEFPKPRPKLHQNNLLTTTPNPYKSSTNTQNQPNVNAENYLLETIMGIESSGVGLQAHHQVAGKPLYDASGPVTTVQPSLSLSCILVWASRTLSLFLWFFSSKPSSLSP